MTTSDRLVFFGTDAVSVPSLIRLLAEEWNLVGVVTKPDSRTGRGQEMSSPAVKRLAQAKRIPVFQPTKLSEINDDLAKLKPDAGVVVAYGKLIPVSTLELFPKGLINVHPSLLPKYRGATPIEAAILNGDDTTGVTLMQVEKGMDSGPTFVCSKLQLSGTETRADLYEQLSEMGAELLSAHLSAILQGQIVPIPQDHSLASHVSLITKADGNINWSEPGDVIERQIRGYLGWPGSHAKVAGADVIITAARTNPNSGVAGTPYKTASAELAVYTGQGSLIIDRLKPAGKREMTGPEFLAGHPLS
jgi:methionyl-tRNA formyltransferase